jgi:hypothetical protein
VRRSVFGYLKVHGVAAATGSVAPGDCVAVHRTRERSGACRKSPQRSENGTTPESKEAALVFGPFSEERLRIHRITARLDETQDPEERADLGSELVRALSRYEDTFERALLPHLNGSDDHVLGDLDRDREALRDPMDDIHQRTMGIDPRNVHASDGQGFEHSLAAVVAGVRALLEVEDREIGALLSCLGANELQALTEEVTRAFENASERPRPPRTAVGRFLSNVHVKLDHTLEDVATPHHPGADTVKG